MTGRKKVNSPDEADLLIQKLPCDMGIHRNPRKGTLDAPDVVLEEFEFDNTVMIDEVFPDEFDLDDTQRRISENTKDLIRYEKPILSLGGDHSVSFPVIKALKKENPDLQLVWLDSHLDMKEKVEDNISHDVVVRELLNSGFSEDEIWFVGITRIDDDEEKFLEKHEMNIYRADELESFLEEFNSNEQPVYLSIDIDVLKEELAPGTGYPDGDLELEQVEKVIETVNPKHADVVEVAPPFDEGGKTVENSRKILNKLANTF